MPKNNRTSKKTAAKSTETSVPVTVEETIPAVELTPEGEEITPETSALLSEEEMPNYDFPDVPSEESEIPAATKDAYGYKANSQLSFLASAIETGNYTREELKAAFLVRFSPDATKSGDVKAKLTSFGVFLSDVKRSIITGYAAARSLVIVTDEKTGKLSFDRKRSELVKERIGAGLFAELRGASKASKAATLRRVGLPYEK